MGYELGPEVISRYQGGETLRDIARDEGTSFQTIRRRLLQAGIEIRDYRQGDRVQSGKRRRDPVYDEDRLRQMSEQGMTCEEIGEALGRDGEAVRRAMVRRGIPRQPAKARREHNHFWRGGYHVDKHGYILVLMREHPDANRAGYVRQHRLVMEGHLGRRLDPAEVVDHVNGDTSDNRLANLRLFATNDEHLRATLTGVEKLSAEEREERRRAAVQRARQRVASILAASENDADPSL